MTAPATPSGWNHPLEERFGIRAERILDAILRASDLTQRGIRGIIAEEVFLKDVIPAQLNGSDWEVVDVTASDARYDCKVAHKVSGKEVRIQVKNQRLERGEVKVSKGMWVVEVQKTRNGETADGIKTRPYYFTDFDLLAVCLRPGTGNWSKFTFCLARDLIPRKGSPDLMQIMQLIPRTIDGGPWSSNLVERMNAFANSPGNRPPEQNGLLNL